MSTENMTHKINISSILYYYQGH